MNTFFIVTLCVFACLSQKSEAWAEFQPPKIFPSKPPVVYQAGQTATFRCQGSLRWVTWFMPPDAGDSIKRRTSINHVNSHENFIAELTIRDLQFNDTGTLTCAYNGTEDLEAIDKSSKIHLFVEDKEHPLKMTGFEYFRPVQSSSFILPCIPTSPEVNVSLWRNNRRIVDDDYISFDQKVGYRISPVIVSLHSGVFECRANFRGKNDSLFCDIEVLPKTSYVPPPHINMTQARNVMIGDVLTLICSVTVDFNTIVALTWSTPNPSAKLENRLHEPLGTHRNLSWPGTHLKSVEQRLTVFNASRDDQGSYTCSVTDHSGNEQKKTQFVQILEAHQPRLIVYYDGFQTIQCTMGRDCNNKEVQWVVQIESHPQPTVQWYGPGGRKIEETPGLHHMDYTVKNYLGRENSRTVLRINKPKLSNSGTYIVRITNGNITKQENFTLDVRAKPSVQVTVANAQGLYQKGHEYSVNCLAEGYPIPKIQWLFKPCSSYKNCDNGHTVYLGEHERTRNQNAYFSTSKIREVARRSGQIICQACNEIDCIFNSVDFFVTDVDNGGFDVQGPENVLEGEAISLKCSASRYNFTANTLEWYKDTLHGLKKMVNEGRKYIIDTRTTDFSFTKELRVMNVSLGDKGRYVCRVQKSASADEKTYHASASRRLRSRYDYGEDLSDTEELSFKLNVLPLEPPVVIETNLMSQIDSKKPMVINNPEDGIELLCRVAGRPWPLISWTLNGAKLMPTINNSRVQILDDNQVVRISYVSHKDEGVYECHASNAVGSVQVAHMIQLKSTLERDALYANISIPVIVAVVIALLLVIVLIIIAKICYSRNKSKNASVSGGSSSTCPWKDPPTPPTPKLTQFPLQNTSSDAEERVTLASIRNHEECTYGASPHPTCCNGQAVYSHCHYQPAPTPTAITVHDPLLTSSPCECSLQTIPQGTLERQFPHIYGGGFSRNGTLLRSHYAPSHAGTSIYDTNNPVIGRSHSVSPSRRSAEY